MLIYLYIYIHYTHKLISCCFLINSLLSICLYWCHLQIPKIWCLLSHIESLTAYTVQCKRYYGNTPLNQTELGLWQVRMNSWNPAGNLLVTWFLHSYTRERYILYSEYFFVGFKLIMTLLRMYHCKCTIPSPLQCLLNWVGRRMRGILEGRESGRRVYQQHGNLSKI